MIFSRKIMVYDIVKIHKKLGYTISLINAILENYRGSGLGSKSTPQAFQGLTLAY